MQATEQSLSEKDSNCNCTMMLFRYCFFSRVRRGPGRVRRRRLFPALIPVLTCPR